MSLGRWRTWRQQWFFNALYSAGCTKNKHRCTVSNGPILPLSLNATKRTAAHIFRLPEPSIMSTTPGFKQATGLTFTGNSDYKGTKWSRSLNFIQRGLDNFQVYTLDKRIPFTWNSTGGVSEWFFYSLTNIRSELPLKLKSSRSLIYKSNHHTKHRNLHLNVENGYLWTSQSFG